MGAGKRDSTVNDEHVYGLLIIRWLLAFAPASLANALRGLFAARMHALGIALPRGRLWYRTDLAGSLAIRLTPNLGCGHGADIAVRPNSLAYPRGDCAFIILSMKN